MRVMLAVGLTGTVAILFSTGCGGPRVAAPTGDRVLRDHLVAGAQAYARDDRERALRAYGAALTRAELSDNPAGIRAAAQNLAVLKMDAGAWGEAMELLDEAEPYATDPADAAELRLLQARTQWGTGDLVQARQLLEQVLGESGHATPVTRDRARMLLGELALREGKVEEARALSASFETSPPVAVRGRHERLLAALAEQDEDWGQAAGARRREAAAWKAAGDWRSMADALEHLGNDLLKDGQVGPAVDAWLRAARSLAAQDERDRARQILERCEGAGPDDPAVVRGVERLRNAVVPGG